MDLVRGLTLTIALGAAFAGGLWTGILTDDSEEREAAAAARATPTPTPGSTTASAGPYDGEILAFGDYLFVSARSCLERSGFTVDAVAERRAEDAAAALSALGASVPERVLIHVGANGGVAEADLTRIMDVLGPDRVVIWVTIQVPDDPERFTFEAETNERILALADSYPGVRILNWNSFSGAKPPWIFADGNLSPEGCEALARLADSAARIPVAS